MMGRYPNGRCIFLNYPACTGDDDDRRSAAVVVWVVVIVQLQRILGSNALSTGPAIETGHILDVCGSVKVVKRTTSAVAAAGMIAIESCCSVRSDVLSTIARMMIASVSVMVMVRLQRILASDDLSVWQAIEAGDILVVLFIFDVNVVGSIFVFLLSLQRRRCCR